MHRVDLEEGRDCWAACIASILERPLSDLAEFHRLYLQYREACDAPGTVSFSVAMAHHHELVRATGRAIVQFPANLEGVFPVGYSIAVGPSPRSSLIDHAVVAFDGVVMHDPHKSRAGIEQIAGYDLLIPATQ